MSTVVNPKTGRSIKVGGALHKKLIADGTLQSASDSADADEPKYTRETLKNEKITRLRTIWKGLTRESGTKATVPKTKKSFVDAILKLQNPTGELRSAGEDGWMIYMRDSEDGFMPIIEFYMSFDNAMSGAYAVIYDVLKHSFESEDEFEQTIDTVYVEETPVKGSPFYSREGKRISYANISVYIQPVVYGDK